MNCMFFVRKKDSGRSITDYGCVIGSPELGQKPASRRSDCPWHHKKRDISPKKTSEQLGCSLGFAQASCLTTHSDAAVLFLDEMEQAFPNPDNSRLLVISSESAGSTRADDMF